MWEAFTPEQWAAGWETPQTMRRRLRAAAPLEADSRTSQLDFLKSLRTFQKLEEIRIAYLDECRRLPVDQITRQISWLADVLAERCLERAVDETARRFQVKSPAEGFAILGLGKLGGLELNYSSDIDLIFIRANEAPALPNPEGFYTKVTEKVVALLSDYGDDRPLYRVDTRLRPEGSQGQLVWPLGQAVDYYHSQGRTWERQALIRMRPIAGDMSLAKELQMRLEPFIFRSTLTEEAIEDLHRLKAQIESIAETRGQSADHHELEVGLSEGEQQGLGHHASRMPPEGRVPPRRRGRWPGSARRRSGPGSPRST
jgi:glutamate-ammonia-ligase adenylyltransferase